MKHSCQLAIILFAISACAPSRRDDAVDYATAKRAILGIDSLMRAARLGKQNLEQYKNLCEDSVVATYNEWYVESADALARDLLNGVTTPRRDVRFHLYGTTAILSYLETPTEHINNDTIIHTIRITKTFALRDGQWKMAAINISPQHKNYFKPLAKQPKIVAGYTGDYRWSPTNGMPTVINSIYVRGDTLFFKNPDTEGIPMFAVDDSTYMVKDDLIRTRFGKDPKGKVTHLIYVLDDGQTIRLPKVK